MALEVSHVDSIESVNRNQWNQIVEQSELGSVYHRYEWLRAIEFGTSYEPKHVLVSKNGNPIAIFPNFVTGSERTPFYELTSLKLAPGGPLMTTEEETALQLLLDEVPDLCEGAIISNRIQTYDQGYARYHDVFRENGYEQTLTYCDFTLDISREWTEVLAGMDSSKRRVIKQSQEREMEVVEKEVTEETMSDFYDGFSSVMGRVDASYEVPRAFFLELSEFSERLKIFSLLADGEERGMQLFTLDDEQSTLHSEFSAITEEHFEYNSSEVIHGHAIRWGIENGYGTYNFGGTQLDFRDGVFNFKEEFGGRPHPALAWERGCSKLIWPPYKAGRAIFRWYQDRNG